MASRSLYVGKPFSSFTSYGIKELFDFPPGNLPSFNEVIITFSKSKTRLSKIPIIWRPLSGSPSKET